MYPFIDVGSGGHLAGMLAAAERALALCGEDTLIIPGHGSVARKPDLVAYRDMLAELGGRIAKLVEQGKSREEVVAAKPSADHDAEWGRGFMQPDVWVGIVYDGYVAQAAAREAAPAR
jgi:glyoxylase-like metal-dependent hydrolase (beta-lactamase superfamily II)